MNTTRCWLRAAGVVELPVTDQFGLLTEHAYGIAVHTRPAHTRHVKASNVPLSISMRMAVKRQ